MQITALIEAVNYLKEVSANTEILGGYKRLLEVIKEASGKKESPPPGLSGRIEEEKVSLRRLLEGSDPSGLDFESYDLFARLNVNQLFGKRAAEYIDSLDTGAGADYHAIHAELSRRVRQISKLSESLGRFRQLFDQLVPSEVYRSDEGLAGKSTIILYFERRLSIQGMSDLERYTRLWDTILGTFTRLTGEVNLSPEIGNLKNGVLVLGVSAGERCMDAFMTGIEGILKILPRVHEIRRIQVDVSRLTLVNDISGLLDKEIEVLVDQSSMETAQKLVSYYYSDGGEAADEMSAEMSRSLKQVLSFVEKGGRIECRPSGREEEAAALNRSLNGYSAIALDLETLASAMERTGEEEEGDEAEAEAEAGNGNPGESEPDRKSEETLDEASS
jgi:hypothetical protein